MIILVLAAKFSGVLDKVPAYLEKGADGPPLPRHVGTNLPA
jgi:hypothetical protein